LLGLVHDPHPTPANLTDYPKIAQRKGAPDLLRLIHLLLIGCREFRVRLSQFDEFKRVKALGQLTGDFWKLSEQIFTIRTSSRL
jgi:hypothetical protein